MVYLLAFAIRAGLSGRSTFVVRRRSHEPPPRADIRSLVRVLRSGDELDEALRRATRFERVVETNLRHRTEHYESMLGRAGEAERSAERAAAHAEAGRE